MNTNLYVENSNGALRAARKEVYEKVQEYLRFYRDSKGMTSYYKYEAEEIINMARKRWQSIVDTMNENALYLGNSLYKKHIEYANLLIELMKKPEKGFYPIVRRWKDEYSELADLQDRLEINEKKTEDDFLFMDYFNELRIVANKEFLSDLLM